MEAFHRFNVRTRLKRPIAVVLNASLIYVALGMQVQLDSTHGIGCSMAAPKASVLEHSTVSMPTQTHMQG